MFFFSSSQITQREITLKIIPCTRKRISEFPFLSAFPGCRFNKAISAYYARSLTALDFGKISFLSLLNYFFFKYYFICYYMKPKLGRLGRTRRVGSCRLRRGALPSPYAYAENRLNLFQFVCWTLDMRRSRFGQMPQTTEGTTFAGVGSIVCHQLCIHYSCETLHFKNLYAPFIIIIIIYIRL